MDKLAKLPMNQNGVTLLELVFALIIVGTLTALSLPPFLDTIERNRLVSCSNQIVSAVQLAKSQAILTRQNVGAYFDANIGERVTMRVGVDADGDSEISDAEELQRFDCADDDINLTVNPAINFIAFGVTGFRIDGNGQVQYTTCNANAKGKIMTVTTGGATSSADAPEGTC